MLSKLTRKAGSDKEPLSILKSVRAHARAPLYINDLIAFARYSMYVS